MSPLPVRVDMNARRVPSGEYNGRESYAACDTSSRASPPVRGTVQMSPPAANTISRRSGERDGSDRLVRGGTGGGGGRVGANSLGASESSAAMGARRATSTGISRERNGRTVCDRRGKRNRWAVERCNGGTVERWNGGTVERWNGGTATT